MPTTTGINTNHDELLSVDEVAYRTSNASEEFSFTGVSIVGVQSNNSVNNIITVKVTAVMFFANPSLHTDSPASIFKMSYGTDSGGLIGPDDGAAFNSIDQGFVAESFSFSKTTPGYEGIFPSTNGWDWSAFTLTYVAPDSSDTVRAYFDQLEVTVEYENFPAPTPLGLASIQHHTGLLKTEGHIRI